MRITSIIYEFLSYFTDSFKHTSRVKYGITFSTGNISYYKRSLSELKEIINRGDYKNIHVGYDFGIKEVEHMEKLLEIICAEYIKTFDSKIIEDKNINDVIGFFINNPSPTASEIAKELKREIFNPEKDKKLSSKEQFAVDIEDFKAKQFHEYFMKKSSNKR